MVEKMRAGLSAVNLQGNITIKTHRPLSINNSLSHGMCNYNCQLCSVNKPSYCGTYLFQPREVTKALIGRIQEAAASGLYIRYVTNAGNGEPMLHKDFIERIGMFGEMLKTWEASVPAPEVSVVSNGSLLSKPGNLEAVADNGLSLIVSFPTIDAEDYGTVMVGDATRGQVLIEKVKPGIKKALSMLAEKRLGKLYFHISPPNREIIRKSFPQTLDYFTKTARESGVKEIELIMFPATSNRSGLITNKISGTDMYKDLFKAFSGKEINGVTVHMRTVLRRFFKTTGEIVDLVRCYRFPCLWNANFFISGEGDSICCNDQAGRNPQGNILENSIKELLYVKENSPASHICRECDQRPEKFEGTLAACAFSSAVRLKSFLVRGRAQ